MRSTGHLKSVAAALLLVAWVPSTPSTAAERSPTPLPRPSSSPSPLSSNANTPLAAADSKLQLPVVAKPDPKQPAVGLASDVHLDKTPPRKTKGLDLVKAGWSYNCMECHKLFPARWHYEGALNEHKDITLDHGNNRFCLNCHHATNRTAFVDYDGSEIAEADVVLLCAKCHGTIHRDWKAGVHGRQNGYWDPRQGDKTRLRCIQCHDPHSPKFKPIAPLPPLKYPARGANPPHAQTAQHSDKH